MDYPKLTMKYDPKLLQTSARILWTVTTVMIFACLFTGGVAGMTWAIVSEAPWVAVVLAAMSGALIGALVAALIVAPLRLLIQAVLCLADLEDHLNAPLTRMMKEETMKDAA